MKPKLLITESIHESGVKLLTKHFEVCFSPGITRQCLLDVVHDYEVIIVKSVTQVDQQLVNSAHRLKLIGRAGTGVDNIDRQLLNQRGIKLLTVPCANTVSAAELTIAFILLLLRRLHEVSERVRHKDYRRHLLEGRELAQMNIALLGLGNVGMAVFKRLQAFGCTVYGYDHTYRRRQLFATAGGHVCESMRCLFENADLVSLHLSLNQETEGIINPQTLSWCKKGAMLVNTARGKLIDDQALLSYLETGHIAAAAIDVVDPEPPYNSLHRAKKYQHALISHPQVVFTPHIGASTIEAQQRVSMEIATKITQAL